MNRHSFHLTKRIVTRPNGKVVEEFFNDRGEFVAAREAYYPLSLPDAQRHTPVSPPHEDWQHYWNDGFWHQDGNMEMENS